MVVVWRMGTVDSFRCGASETSTAFAGAVASAPGLLRRRGHAAMEHLSSWACVALFYNNISDPPHALENTAKESPVAVAVNSLAWSHLEERLYTGDTDGMIKVGLSMVRVKMMPRVTVALGLWLLSLSTNEARVRGGRGGRRSFASTTQGYQPWDTTI